MQSEEASKNVDVAIDFFKRTYSRELGDYEGHDVFYIVDMLDHLPNDTQQPRHRRHDPLALAGSAVGGILSNLPPPPHHKQYFRRGAIENNSNTDNSTRLGELGGSRRKGTSNGTRWGGMERGRIKRNGGKKISSHSRRSSDRERITSVVTVRSERAIGASTEAESGVDSAPPHPSEGHNGAVGQSHLAHDLLEIAHIFHFVSIAILGVFVVQVICLFVITMSYLGDVG